MTEFFANNFNTELTEQEEKAYQTWIQQVKTITGRDLSKDTETYDMRGFWKEAPGEQLQRILDDNDAHFTDKYKKPNHPTFSNESQYSKGEWEGGTWSYDGKKEIFTPSRRMLEKTHPSGWLEWYFKKALPESELVLPEP